MNLEELNGKVAVAWAIVQNDPPYKIPAFAKSILFVPNKIILKYDCAGLPELDAIACGQSFSYKPNHTLTDQLTVSLNQKEGDWATGTAYSAVDNRFTIAEEQPDIIAYIAGSTNVATPITQLKWSGKIISAPVRYLHKMLTVVRVRLNYKDVCLINPTASINPIMVYCIITENSQRSLVSAKGLIEPLEFDVGSSTRTIQIGSLSEIATKSIPS